MTAIYRVADFIADFIADLGVEHVFMLAGGGAMHLNDGLACSKRLQAVPCHHEQAAAIAAEAYGRVHPCGIGVVMVTSGPGATNAITAVAGAWIESIPMLIISGQVKRADLLRGRSLRQMGVQEVETVPMVKGITKYAKTLEEPTEIEAECRKAIALAREGRGGPVWLDIPLDVQGAPFPEQKPLDENTFAPNKDVTDLDAVAVEIMNMLKMQNVRCYWLGTESGWLVPRSRLLDSSMICKSQASLPGMRWTCWNMNIHATSAGPAWWPCGLQISRYKTVIYY